MAPATRCYTILLHYFWSDDKLRYVLGHLFGMLGGIGVPIEITVGSTLVLRILGFTLCVVVIQDKGSQNNNASVKLGPDTMCRHLMDHHQH